jgi:hypothetical protein
MIRLLGLRVTALFRDGRRRLPSIGWVVSEIGVATPSDSVTNRSISHRPAGPGGESTL